MTRKVLRARDVMSSPVKAVELGTTLDEVAARLADEGVTGLLVVDGAGRHVGVVSHADLVGYVAGLERGEGPTGGFYYQGNALELSRIDEDALRSTTVDTIMTPEVIWVPDGMKLPDVARVMVERRVHRVLVERAGVIVGIVSTLDLLAAFAAPPRAPARKPPARKAPARKTTARKTPARKTPARKTPAGRTASREQEAPARRPRKRR